MKASKLAEWLTGAQSLKPFLKTLHLELLEGRFSLLHPAVLVGAETVAVLLNEWTH